MIRAAVRIGRHADQLIALEFGFERTADAAIRARRFDDAIGLAVVDDRFLDQRGGGARLHARAARYAFGIDESCLPALAAIDRIETAAGNGERERSLHFFARAHAARADDALRRIEREVGVRCVLRLVEVIRAGEAVAHVAQSDFAGNVLQLAIAVGRARQAVERMIGDVEFEHAFAHPRQRLRLGAHDHARLRPGSCTTPACLCDPEFPRGRRDTIRTARANRWRRVSECRFRRPSAARITEVPAGRVDVDAVDRQAHRSRRRGRRACRDRDARGRRFMMFIATPVRIRSAAKVLENAANGHRRESTQRAQRTGLHRFAQIFEQCNVRVDAIRRDGCAGSLRRRAPSRCGTACICRTIRARRTASRIPPARRGRRCRRTRRCRRGRASPHRAANAS